MADHWLIIILAVAVWLLFCWAARPGDDHNGF